MNSYKKKNSLKIHYLQHVPFEGLGSMAPYLGSRGHILTSTHLYKGEELPATEVLDWLIVMGGPMGVYDQSDYPWLENEKNFIRACIESGKTVLGVCLGAQMIAEVMGASVVKNRNREIGWFPVTRNEAVSDTLLDSVLPPSFDAFHWHGDMFEIPEGAIPLGSSIACDNQGFIYDNRVLGIQFHLETTLDSASALIENCRDELDDSQYVQTERYMLSDKRRFAQINEVMRDMLFNLERAVERTHMAQALDPPSYTKKSSSPTR